VNQPTPEALRVAESARTIDLQMMSERGRGAVLVGGARVDAALEALLKAALAPPSGPETLFLTDRPLGSFGARIALARRLGLIDRQVDLALHTLRRVRNAFAHSTAQASLSEACHHQPLAECYRQARCNTLWDPLERIIDDQLRSNAGSADTTALTPPAGLRPVDHHLDGFPRSNRPATITASGSCLDGFCRRKQKQQQRSRFLSALYC
jgi:hypothetical protein